MHVFRVQSILFSIENNIFYVNNIFLQQELCMCRVCSHPCWFVLSFVFYFSNLQTRAVFFLLIMHVLRVKPSCTRTPSGIPYRQTSVSAFTLDVYGDAEPMHAGVAQEPPSHRWSIIPNKLSRAHTLFFPSQTAPLAIRSENMEPSARKLAFPGTYPLYPSTETRHFYTSRTPDRVVHSTP